MCGVWRNKSINYKISYNFFLISSKWITVCFKRQNVLSLAHQGVPVKYIKFVKLLEVKVKNQQRSKVKGQTKTRYCSLRGLQFKNVQKQGAALFSTLKWYCNT